MSAKRRRSQPNMAEVVQVSKDKKKRLFSREIQLMMYGFGDGPSPRPDSCEIVEELVMEYIVELVRHCNLYSFILLTLQCKSASNASRQKDKVKVEDILFCLRKDPTKLARAEELLFRLEELNKARKAFDPTAGDY